MLDPANVLITFELLAQRLDDDFFGVVDLVHHQPELAPVGLQHHDVDRAIADPPVDRGLGELAVRGSDTPAAANVPAAGTREPMDHLDSRPRFVRLEPHQFEQAHLGNGVAIAAAGHDRARE